MNETMERFWEIIDEIEAGKSEGLLYRLLRLYDDIGKKSRPFLVSGDMGVIDLLIRYFQSGCGKARLCKLWAKSHLIKEIAFLVNYFYKEKRSRISAYSAESISRRRIRIILATMLQEFYNLGKKSWSARSLKNSEVFQFYFKWNDEITRFDVKIAHWEADMAHSQKRILEMQKRYC